jgi:hypothetical protein
VKRLCGVACASALLLPLTGTAQSSQRTPVVQTPHFAFHSDFDTNLNDALIAAGVARKDKKSEIFHAGPEASCFDSLPAATRTAWDDAVDYYAKTISPVDWTAPPQSLLRLELVGFGAADRRANATTFVRTARSYLASAAPAYRACRWTAQDEHNRRWIQELQPRLARHEQRIAARLVQLYGTTWRVLPVLVDVVETVNWSGANTAWSDSGQGHVLISREPGGDAALEILFHEASHVLMDRAAPVRRALEEAARAADVRLPSDLWHVVLFFTTGEAVRRVLDAEAPSGYTPALYEIFGRGSWVEYRQALEREWRPYVDGERSLGEAARSLVASLPRR